MDKDEFERLKQEEKDHLRKLRALKQTHREVQRKASILGALRGMRNPHLEAETDALTEGVQRNAATQEARLELALDAEKQAAQEEADRETLRQSEAEALVRQMKAEFGAGPAPSTPDAPPRAAPAPADGKTIGRAPAEPEPTAPSDRDPKTIGRPRDA